MDKEEIKPPCEHMKPLLNREADGSLKGPSKWFTLFHVLHCAGCRRFLKNLRDLIENMRKTREEETDNDAISRLSQVVRDQAAEAGGPGKS